MHEAPELSFAGLVDINWEDPGSILEGAAPIFAALTAETQNLDALLSNLEMDSHLRDMCERYDFLDKLVLHDDTASQVRVRLHLYRSGYFDRPHNHRWSFASSIIRGSYRHKFYGDDGQFTEETDPDTLLPLQERIEGAGSSYALHHTSVHAVQAEADTISLLLRGPAAKTRFLILDREAGGSFWVYGAAQESPEQRASKQMPAADLDETIARLRTLIADSLPLPATHS